MEGSVKAREPTARARRRSSRVGVSSSPMASMDSTRRYGAPQYPYAQVNIIWLIAVVPCACGVTRSSRLADHVRLADWHPRSSTRANPNVETVSASSPSGPPAGVCG